MKYLKTYETISSHYKIGDYLIIKIRSKGVLYDNIIAKILNINQGDIIIKILDNDLFNKEKYLINNHHIQYWSESKEELEQFITTRKYNL